MNEPLSNVAVAMHKNPGLAVEVLERQFAQVSHGAAFARVDGVGR